MVPKLTTGNGFGGTLRYDKRQGMDIDPNLVKILDVSGVSFDYEDKFGFVIDTKQAARDFRIQTMGYKGDRDIRKPVYHWSLSYHPKDNVTEEQMVDDAKDFLHRIGFDDTQYIIIAHYDKKHKHVHIPTNIVNNKGHRIPTMGLIDKAHAAAAAITKERGYTWGEKAQDKSLGIVHDPHERARIALKSIVNDALSKALSLEGFQKELESRGVSVVLLQTGDGKRGGISFGYEYEGRLHTFRGSSLGRQLSYGFVIKRIEKNSELSCTPLTEPQESHESINDVKSGESSARLLIGKDKQDEELTQAYKNTWYIFLKPQYEKMFAICNELYERRKDTWASIAENKDEISVRFSQIRELKSYSLKLQNEIDAANNSKAVVSAVTASLFFINPLAAIALKVIASLVIDANRNRNIKRRRSTRAEMSSLFNEIETLKTQQKALKAEAKDLLKEYESTQAEKAAFKEAYESIKQQLEIPVIEKKFEKISRFFPDAQELIEGGIRKSKAGYDMFFVEVDGEKHVAVDFGEKVVVSREKVEGSFKMSELNWKDEADNSYKFDGKELKEDIFGGLNLDDFSDVLARANLFSSEKESKEAAALKAVEILNTCFLQSSNSHELEDALLRKGMIAKPISFKSTEIICDLELQYHGYSFKLNDIESKQTLKTFLDCWSNISGAENIFEYVNRIEQERKQAERQKEEQRLREKQEIAEQVQNKSSKGWSIH